MQKAEGTTRQWFLIKFLKGSPPLPSFMFLFVLSHGFWFPSCHGKGRRRKDKRRREDRFCHTQVGKWSEERIFDATKERSAECLEGEGEENTRQCEMSISKNSGAVFIIMTCSGEPGQKLEKCNSAPKTLLLIFLPSSCIAPMERGGTEKERRRPRAAATKCTRSRFASFELNPERNSKPEPERKTQKWLLLN